MENTQKKTNIILVIVAVILLIVCIILTVIMSNKKETAPTPEESSATIEMTEEELQIAILEAVKNESKIIDSYVDTTFGWTITKNESTYNISYQSDYFYGGDYGIVYNVECIYNSVTGELTQSILIDNRDIYDPNTDYKNYDPFATDDSEFIPTEFTGKDAEVLDFVKKHCTWYDSWYKTNYPNGMTKSNYCQWNVVQTDSNTWQGSLEAIGGTGGYEAYSFTCKWNGSKYEITSEMLNI